MIKWMKEKAENKRANSHSIYTDTWPLLFLIIIFSFCFLIRIRFFMYATVNCHMIWFQYAFLLINKFIKCSSNETTQMNHQKIIIIMNFTERNVNLPAMRIVELEKIHL